MIARTLRFVLASVVALSACLAAAEAGRRILDGYRLWSVALVESPGNTDLLSSAGKPSMVALLGTIDRDAEADESWFDDRPQPLSGSSVRWADQRRAAFGPEANYIWNAATLDDPTAQAFLQRNQDRLREILTFRTPDGGRHPPYRLYPEMQSGFGFTNQFGWRGRPIQRAKAANVVRIGVLGDSTTSGYPALLEHWLNLWSARHGRGIRFEVINAARPSTGALDAAAILEYELDAVDPDYLVIYGFGNGIYFADALVTLPAGVVRGQPPPPAAGVLETAAARISQKLEPAARWSASARFLQGRLKGQLSGAPLPEPQKPASRIAFPAGIDEASPDPAAIAGHAGGGVMLLDAYLQALNRIDAATKNRGIQLFVSSFRVMAFEGMLLGSNNDGTGHIVYDHLNKGLWWPYTYAELHRLGDFYNRVLQTWSRARGHRTIPVNERMPWIPELYRDGLHELAEGEALHAWIVLQELLPAIRDDLARHRLPRAGSGSRAAVDAYWQVERTRVVDVANVVAVAPRGAAEETEIPSAIPAAPSRSVDEIPGAFALSRLVTTDPTTEIVPGIVPLIRTPADGQARAAFLRVEAAGLAGKGRLRARIRVSEGRVLLGTLSRSTRDVPSFVRVSQSGDLQDISIPIDDLADVESLMISNDRAGETARSVVELHSVVLQRAGGERERSAARR